MKIYVDDFEVDMFPAIEDVFSADIEKCRKVFSPFYSLKLSDINFNWGEEKIHLVQFNEDPYNQSTVQYFNEYCKGNMIAFDLRNGKYQFKTDFGYFDVTDDWKEYPQRTKDSYKISKNDFLNNNSKIDTDDIVFGGEPEWWQSDETPFDPDGNPMEFVTEFETDQICNDSCGKKIFLFYSPKFKIAVQIYQIT